MPTRGYNYAAEFHHNNRSRYHLIILPNPPPRLVTTFSKLRRCRFDKNYKLRQMECTSSSSSMMSTPARQITPKVEYCMPNTGLIDNTSKTTTITSTTLLPSSSTSTNDCVICGVPAFGVHYAVWSCNGCKTFFRRAIMENRKYSCARDGNCPIDAKNRCCCRHCRFQKCIRVGMTFTEINVERKRKIHIENSFDLAKTVNSQVDDPMIRELLAKESKFRVLLNSTRTPTYTSLDQALASSSKSIFDGPMDVFEKHKLGTDSHMDFYDWRAQILSIIIEWIKSFSEFMKLSSSDQRALVVHSAFALLAFSEAFHTPERFTDRLVYPDGLQVTRNFSKGVCIPQNGLIRSMVAVINNILTPIRRIQLTEMEYVFMQTLLLFDNDCLSLSQHALEVVRTKRDSVLACLHKYLHSKSYESNKSDEVGSEGIASRMGQLLLRIPNIHKVAMFKRQFFRESATLLLGPNCAKSKLAIELASLYPGTSFF